MEAKFRHLRHEGVRGWIEASEGQRALSFVHSWVRSALATTGAFRAGAAFPAFTSVVFGTLTSEQVTACLERLVQLGELAELTTLAEPDGDRVFTTTRSARNVRHIGLVLVLTELEKAGKGVTIDSLCERVHGERDQVVALVRELYERGKVSLAGEWVALVPKLVVHVVHGGTALCGKAGPPGYWGPGHKWVRWESDENGPRSAVNCPVCQDRSGLGEGVGGSRACTNPRRDCARDGDCPEHGKDRPGQCIATPVASEPPQGDSWNGAECSMPGGWKGRL